MKAVRSLRPNGTLMRAPGFAWLSSGVSRYVNVCATCNGTATSTNRAPQRGTTDSIGSCASLWLAVKIVSHLLQIFPRLAFLRRVAQQVSRMKCRHHFDAFVIVKTAACACDALARLAQGSQRGVAEHNDDCRLRGGDFAFQKRFAGGGFVRHRRSVLRRTTTIYVTDQNLFAFRPYRLEDLRE